MTVIYASGNVPGSFEVQSESPTVTSFIPANGATSVIPDNNLVLTFNKAVVANTGDIVIYKPDNTPFETIAVTDDKVTISGSEVTINPNGVFASGTTYYIQMAATALDDTVGNSYDGISDTTTWYFTTIAYTDRVDNNVASGLTQYTVIAPAADTLVTVTTAAPITITILSYYSNPHPTVALPTSALPNSFIDVSINNLDAIVWPSYVKQTYTNAQVSGMVESSLRLYYFKDADNAWIRLSDTGVDMAGNFVSANMTEAESSGSQLVIGGTAAGGGGGGLPPAPAPAAFSISDLSIQPAEVQPGESVTITVSVANTGGTEGSYSVVLNINGAKEAEKSVTIAAGSNQDVSFSVTKEDAGSYRVSVVGLSGSFTVVALAPATFLVLFLRIQPAEVQPGEPVTITLSVANTGGTAGRYLLSLKINGETDIVKSITIAAGSRQDVSFSVTREDADTYSVMVGGLSGSFTVVAPALPEEEEEEEEEEVAPPLTPPSEPVPPQEEEEVPEARTEPFNLPLIGGLIGAAVATALVVIFRRKVSQALGILFPRLSRE